MKFARSLLKIACAALLVGAGSSGIAQTYPTKPITIINPYASGGTLDVLARLLGEQVSKSLGQPVIVENKPGAGSTIGAAYVARAKPDGYTLLITAGNIVSAPALGMPVQYDWKTSFAPITILGTIPQVLTVPAELPVHTVQEFIQFAKTSPKPLAIGSLGPGSGGQINGKLLQQAVGITLVDVPFKGMSETMTALAGGHIQVAFGNLPEVLTYQKGGKMRALAVTIPTRSKLAPDLPTLAESGLADVIIPVWYGLLAPAGTPPELITRLRTVFSNAVHSPELQKRLDMLAISPVGGSPEEFRRQLEDEYNMYLKMAKAR